MPTGVSTSATTTQFSVPTASGPTIVYKTDDARTVRSYLLVAHEPTPRPARDR